MTRRSARQKMSKGSQYFPPIPVMVGAYDKYVDEPTITSIRDNVVSEIEALKPYAQHRIFSGYSLLVGPQLHGRTQSKSR